MTHSLSIQNITAHYGTTKVLEDLSLDIAEGELVSLLGASGCGKTTTLRLVAGFLEPTSGKIELGGRDLTRLPAYQRNIGLVFQNYALFPHLSVADNVGFGLKQRGIGGEARTKRVAAMLERVGLGHLADRLPGALSGGQKQRVALARALVQHFGRIELHDAARIHDRHAIRDREGFFLIVGHIDRGGAVGALQLADFHPHVDAQLGIEVGQGLVKHQQWRLDDEGAGQRHALLLATRKGARQPVGEMAKADALEHGGNPLGARFPANAALLEAEADIVGHRQMRK